MEKTKDQLLTERQQFAEQEIAALYAYVPETVIDLHQFGILLRAAAAALEQYRIASWGVEAHEARARQMLVDLAQHSSDTKDRILGAEL